MKGPLAKMRSTLDNPVRYALPVGDDSVDLNQYLGQTIKLTYTGAINCTHCGRKTNKSFSQGYCYPCFKSLARCDMCIVKPEMCHYRLGTCREPEWGEAFCFRPHVVYLANSSGLKVGITRKTQIPTRWIDQGASQALPILEVESRYRSGLVEVILAQQVNDKTNWRALLKGRPDEVDLEGARDKLLESSEQALLALCEQADAPVYKTLPDEKPIHIEYPVLQYPEKITSFNFDKSPEVVGTLMGIKGQYLILDTGVINIRKFTAYNIAFE